ncbi:PREDICTED: 40S ribosomal protein SA-like [Odobenus rosmarus divergens]|uniref:40S ribosomal protein SA-like n=1 Tax=Odobenus rosmarus divergens TaxID=9708 RepID=A0A9B0H1X0_ODORO
MALWHDDQGFRPSLKGNVYNVQSPDILQVKKDGLKFLAAGTRLSDNNIDLQIHLQKERCDGIYTINLKSTWKQLLLLAHAIVAMGDVADVSVTSSRNTGQGDGLKFAAASRTTPTVGCLASGSFTSQMQAASQESHVLMVTDPRDGHQPLKDMSYANLCTSLYNPSMPDFYFYRDPEEIEKEDQVAAKKTVTKEGFQGKCTATQPEV